MARLAFGMPAPKQSRRGVDVAGVVEAVGKGVTGIQPGDEVFGWCDGAFAEHATAAEDHFVAKPASMSFVEAAAVPVAAVTALQGLRNVGKLQSGQRVLINGAAGGVGTYAVQIAKSFGAAVTGVCSTRNVELVRSLGADRVIDYTREDFGRDRGRYDLVFDNAGSRSIGTLLDTLAPGGTLVYNSGASMPRMAMAAIQSRIGRNVRTFLAHITHADLVSLRDLIAAGKLRSVIDRTFPLDQAGAAIAYVEAGHARGKVVVTVP
jgi:NADPH:quinone reductase-like Zn-dependent oxidoreductase